MAAAPTFVDVLGQAIAVPEPQSAVKGKAKGKNKGKGKGKGAQGKGGGGEDPQKPPDGADPVDPDPEVVTTPLVKAKSLAKSVPLG